MDEWKLIDLYRQRQAEKEPGLLDFLEGRKPFIVIQRPPSNVWGMCNTVETVYQNNIESFAKALQFPWTDDLPYLEPWVGTGVYASAFGCQYLWRDNDAPDTYYRYHTIEEVRHLEYPDYRQSPIMSMVLDCIDCLKDRTHGELPICLTDTQSPFDTATMVLDAAEFFVACYAEEETVRHVMDLVTRLLIEFSRVQTERIGSHLVAKPGHIMPSCTTHRGISISDDNLAVSSPSINEKIALPFDQQIADAFDGVAIHSCGRWAHTMEKLKRLRKVLMIDCAITTGNDPTPHAPAEVRDALKGSNIIAKVRLGDDLPRILPLIEELFDPSLRLILHIGYSEENAETNYKTVRDKLAELYQP